MCLAGLFLYIGPVKKKTTAFKWWVKFAHLPLIQPMLSGLAPVAFSRMHQRIQFHKDEEFSLLPILCDPQRISLDVGVLFGGYAREMLDHSQQVFMIEANPLQVAFLRRAFPDQSERIISSAAGASTGEIEIRVPSLMPGNATVESENHLDRHKKLLSFTVPIRPLDELFPESEVGFIKIDVEGHENAVLSGAQRLIQRCRPKVILECIDDHKKGAVAKMRSFFQEMEYAVLFLSENALHDIAEYDASYIDPSKRNSKAFVNNFIAVPKEELDSFQARFSADQLS